MKKLILLFLVLISLKSFAQKESYMWYFGYNAGLDFNTSPPTVLTNGAMSQFEGVSSIADNNGLLLFYTDGASVWNKNHVTMPNGFALGGGSSSTQSALISPQPNTPGIYYIFCNDQQLGPNGFTYSIVDITLNGGLGDVTVKAQPMFTPSTEKVTACNHANGQDIWIISHEWNTNNWLTYTLTSTGFNTTPVVSSAGPIMQGSSVNTIGYLKASPNGQRLACAISGDNQFWLFDFNPATGVVSNPMQLNSAPPGGNGAYGVEFSPNSQVLYGSVEGPPMYLYQWDLSSGNVTTINNSRISLNPQLVGATFSGSLGLAPDGKIYYTRNTCNYLGAINNPDVVGLGCNFEDSAIYLQGTQCVYGLPNLNQSYYSGTFQYDKVCFGDSTHFSITNTTGLLGVAWDFGDPGSGINNSSNIFNPAHLFTAPGTYYVQLIKYYLFFNDTITDSVPVFGIPTVNLGVDTSFCDNQTVLLDAGSGYVGYLWQDGSTNSTFTVTQSGTYFVTANNVACSATDSITLTEIPCAPSINLSSSDTTFCEKQCIDFYDLSTNNPITWQWFFTGASPDTSTLQNPTNICYNNYGSFDVMLIACSALGCDTLVLTNFIQEFQNPTDSITFDGVTLTSEPFMTYQWYEVSTGIITGATSQTYVPTGPGSYYCLVTDSIGCVATSNNVVITGISDMVSNNADFQVVPNPNNGNFYLLLNSDAFKSNCSLRIFDAIGKIVYQSKVEVINNRIEINSESIQLKQGLYFIELQTSNTISRNQFLIKE